MEWIKILKESLVENKIFIDVFSSIFVGIASIIVGVAGIIFSNLQLKISKQQLILQKQEIQPVFRIVFSLKKDDNSGKYTNEYISIYNDGKTVKSFKSEINTYYKIIYSSTSKKIYNEEYYIKVNGFYFRKHTTQNLTGELLKGGIDNNNAEYARLYFEALDYSKNGEFYFTERYSLIKITYKDINNENHTVYFKDRFPITEEEYNELSNKPTIFDFPVEFDKVNLQEIIQQIKIAK
jgi:hypothetical protein